MAVVRSKDMDGLSWSNWATNLCKTIKHSADLKIAGPSVPNGFEHSFRDVVSRMIRMNDDELEIMCQHAIRIDEGRKEYGPLHIDSDERDMGAEAIEELIDTVNYLTFKLMKMQRGRQ